MEVHVLFKLNQQQQQQFQQISNNQQDLESQANKIGITDEQYAQVKSFLDTHNVTVQLDKLHTSVEVDGATSAMGTIFQTTFVNHKYQNREFYAPKTPPRIPSQLASLIVSVTGLDSYSAPVKPRSFAHHNLPTASNAANCNIPSGADTSTDVGHAYGYDQLRSKGFQGQNMTINLVEIDGFFPSDVNNYAECVGYKGKISVKTIGPAPDPNKAVGETTLDIEMIEGLAPLVNIVDYQTGDASFNSLSQVLRQVINDNTKTGAGNVVSMSLGAAENALTLNTLKGIDQQLDVLTNVEHMTVFVSSGDCAAYSDEVFGSLSVDFFASDPNVVAVGGTDLATNGQHSRVQEVAWFDDQPDQNQCRNTWGSGGGNSNYFQLPDWQTGNGVKNEDSRGFRQVPDIAAVATNLPIYLEGQWTDSGGTSAASPIWATGMILVNQALIHNYQKYAHGPRLFYYIANSAGSYKPYFDVTAGNNGFEAGQGWDFVTGLGSPNLVDFYNVLAEAASKK
jgi:kumamolisin